MARLIGIDVGTTSVKGGVFDEDGNTLATATTPSDTEIPTYSSHDGVWSEQDPEDWRNHSKENIRTLVEKAGISPDDEVFIGVSGQMHGGVFLDEKGKPVRKAIIWNDTRTGEEAKSISEIYGKNVGHFTVAKGLWLRVNESYTFARAKTMFLPEDYVVFKLTGKRSTTTQGLSQMRAWDFSKAARDVDLLNDLGLSHLIPQVLPNMAHHARLTDEVADELGLKRGTLVTARLGDQESASTGVGAVEIGYASLNSGTSGIIDVVTDSNTDFAENGIYKFLQANNLGLLVACTFGCGSSYQYARDAFGRDLKMGAKPYILMDLAAAEAPPGAGGIIFLPYGNGGDRSPIDDNTIRGAFLGIDYGLYTEKEQGKQREYLLRAVLEGIAHSFRHNQEVLAKHGITLKKLRAAKTGVLSSDLFAQMVSDHLGVPIEFVDTEGGCFGVALAAGVGGGVYPSIEKACETTIKPTHTVTPIPENRGVLTDGYNRYIQCYEALAPVFADKK